MTREEQIARAMPAIESLKNYQQQLDADGCMVGVSRQALDETLAFVATILATEAAPSEPLDDKLVYIKPLRTLVRVQTMYADQVRDLCNAPAAPLYAHPPAQPVQTPAQVSDADGRGKISLRVGTPDEIANYKAAFASMRSPSGQAAMMPMMETVGNNADAIQKLLGDFSPGELFNALLSRINFDGMDPRTFSLAELQGAIEGAEWPKAPPTAQPDTTKSGPTKPHHGRIRDWYKLPCGNGLGYYIMGTLLDHPTIPVKHTNTSWVEKHDLATGEIETRNSRYTLLGAEKTP